MDGARAGCRGRERSLRSEGMWGVRLGLAFVFVSGCGPAPAPERPKEPMVEETAPDAPVVAEPKPEPAVEPEPEPEPVVEPPPAPRPKPPPEPTCSELEAVSYTHLTLPTIYSV